MRDKSAPVCKWTDLGTSSTVTIFGNKSSYQASHNTYKCNQSVNETSHLVSWCFCKWGIDHIKTQHEAREDDWAIDVGRCCLRICQETRDTTGTLIREEGHKGAYDVDHLVAKGKAPEQ